MELQKVVFGGLSALRATEDKIAIKKKFRLPDMECGDKRQRKSMKVELIEATVSLHLISRMRCKIDEDCI